MRNHSFIVVPIALARTLLLAMLLTFCSVHLCVPGSIWVRASDDCVIDVMTGECSVHPSSVKEERDPHLRPMTYNVGAGEQTVFVFMEPTLEEMYQQKKDVTGVLQKVTPDFNGFAGKFINMSNKKCTLFW
jgi:hypothetical protein